MKQLTCAQMGGPATCTAVLAGNTPEEMIASGMKHVTAAHPDMAEGMKTMPKETLEKWRADFQKTWDATPEKK